MVLLMVWLCAGKAFTLCKSLRMYIPISNINKTLQRIWLECQIALPVGYRQTSLGMAARA